MKLSNITFSPPLFEPWSLLIMVMDERFSYLFIFYNVDKKPLMVFMQIHEKQLQTVKYSNILSSEFKIIHRFKI